MCREVWRAAGKVWAREAKEQREVERADERQRRADHARKQASARSLAKRRKQAQRERNWLLKGQRLAAVDALEEKVVALRGEGGRTLGTGDLRVLLQHSYWRWRRIMQWWRSTQKQRQVKATREVTASVAAVAQPPKRQRTLQEMWGGRGGESGCGRQRPMRKPPEAASEGRRFGKRRSRGEAVLVGAGVQEGRKKRRRRFRRVPQLSASESDSENDTVGVG